MTATLFGAKGKSTLTGALGSSAAFHAVPSDAFTTWAHVIT